jgi:hypothetical protein
MMIADQELPSEEVPDEINILRGRAAELEQQLSEARKHAEVRLIHSELKVEAVRAGIVDIDGLKLLDTSSVSIGPNGNVMGATELIKSFRASKPWLFGAAFSSRPVQAPPSQPPRSKSATDMTDAEYAAARAAILRQSA